MRGAGRSIPRFVSFARDSSNDFVPGVLGAHLQTRRSPSGADLFRPLSSKMVWGDGRGVVDRDLVDIVHAITHIIPFNLEIPSPFEL